MITQKINDYDSYYDKLSEIPVSLYQSDARSQGSTKHMGLKHRQQPALPSPSSNHGSSHGNNHGRASYRRSGTSISNNSSASGGQRLRISMKSIKKRDFRKKV